MADDSTSPVFENADPPADRQQPDSFDGPGTFTRRIVSACAIGSLFLVAFLLLFYAPDVLLLTFAAVWFGVVIRHASKKVAHWTHLSFGWAMGIVVALLLAAFAGFFVLLGWQIAAQINDLASNLGDAVKSLEDRLNDYPAIRKVMKQAPSAEKAVQDLSGSRSIRGLLMSPFGLVVNVLFIFFTGLYLANDAELYTRGVTRLFPVHYRHTVYRVFNEAATRLWKWTIARLASMAIVGTLAGIGLALMQIPMAVTLGFLTGLLVFVPNIGPVLAMIAPVLMALSKGGMWPVYVVLLYVGIELVESYLITPIIHQKEDNLPAAIVIASQLLLGVLFGLLGVTFAMPIALVLLVFVQRLYVERTLEHRDSPPPEAA